MTQATSEKISELTAAAQLTSSAILPVADGGVTYRAAVGTVLLRVQAEHYGLSASKTGAENATALTNALAAVAAGGEVLISTAGTYTVSSVTLTSRSIVGTRGVTLKRVAAAASAMFVVTGSGCSIRNLKIDGDGTNQSSDVVAVTLTTAPNFLLEDVEVTNLRYKFLLTDEGGELSPDGRIINCYFHDTGTVINCDVVGIRSSRWLVLGSSFFDVGDGHCIRTGLYTDNIALGPVRDTRVIGCHFQDTDHVGITVELHTQGIIVDGCFFRNLEQGVKFEDAGATVYGAIVTNNEFRDLTITTAFNWSVPGTYSNNRCYNCAGGFTFNLGPIVCSGNLLDACGQVTEASIRDVTTRTGTIEIIGNTVLNAPENGIEVQAGSAVVVGNVVKNAAAIGIQVRLGGNIVSSNYVDGCTVGIALSSTTTETEVSGNLLKNYSSSAVSFTNNVAFSSVRVRSNVGYAVVVNHVIASGVITAGLSDCSIILDTEASAATDDLDTITASSGIVPGQVLVIRSNANARDPTIKHNTGNLILVGAVDFTLATTASKIALMWSGTKWQELWRATA